MNVVRETYVPHNPGWSAETEKGQVVRIITIGGKPVAVVIYEP